MKNLFNNKSFFILGIKGVAMANIAVMIKKMGKQVTGIDSKEEFITDIVLKENKIPFITESIIACFTKLSDVYIYSAAHNGRDNPIIIKAIQKDKTIVSQAEFIENLRKLFSISIAVSGCHGKTTTSSLLAYSLKQLNAKPTYIVGTSSFQGSYGGDYQEDTDYFVFEADEYGIQPPIDIRPKLLMYNPNYIICTNIDFDHPDVYTNIEDVKKTFLTFFSDHKLFLCLDDPHIQSLLPKLDRKQYKTFGFSDNSDLKLIPFSSNESETTFYAIYCGTNLGLFTISLFGDKNISNAGGVILALLELGFSVDQIKGSIKTFGSVKRRFELIYKKNDLFLFDDYAHHPTEIDATIQAIRKRFVSKRIIVIFQPHTFSRTEAFKKPLILSLSKADITFIAPIFPSARENQDNFMIDLDKLRKEVRSSHLSNIFVCDTKHEIIEKLTKQLHSNDIVVTMGAGDIYKLKDDIIELINSNES